LHPAYLVHSSSVSLVSSPK
jgi:hypothetical protein